MQQLRNIFDTVLRLAIALVFLAIVIAIMFGVVKLFSYGFDFLIDPILSFTIEGQSPFAAQLIFAVEIVGLGLLALAIASMITRKPPGPTAIKIMGLTLVMSAMTVLKAVLGLFL